MTDQQISPRWTDVAGKQATLLQTRKRDGAWVKTPVTAIDRGDIAWFLTDAATAKVKRIRNFPDVRVGSCTFRGDPTGPTYSATARILDGAEARIALAAIRRAHPIVFGVVIRARYRFARRQPMMVELAALRPLDTGD